MPKQVTHEDLLFVHKPNGVPTHRPSPKHMGFVEWLEEKNQQKYWVCHRLDKETSGAMLFAKNKKAAQDLTELFSAQSIKKQYLFVSDKKSKFENWVVFDDKEKGTLLHECPFDLKEGFGYLSFTEFQRVSAQGPLYLYKAFPRTGKTHQIRKHAFHSEVSILGDDLYEGKSFPRLMLHCLQLSGEWRGEKFEFNSQASRLFENLELCDDLQFSRWVIAFERRETLFPERLEGKEALRLFHTETGDLRGEKAGEKTMLGWWKSAKPTKDEQIKIEQLMLKLKVPEWTFQWRPGAQEKESTELLLHSKNFSPDPWTFQENEIVYEGSLERGQNFGLFLDQRDRRFWVKQNSQGKKVLNLFAFTCGFSVNAALGGADQVVSVDLFEKYLQWGRQNFRLNQLNPDSSQYEWRRMDSLDYLSFAEKKGLQFDVIVCDPPSFSRQKKSKKVFRVDRDYKNLIMQCLGCLAPQGTLLFSTNFEKWGLEKWQSELESLKLNHCDLKINISPSQWDFEWQM